MQLYLKLFAIFLASIFAFGCAKPKSSISLFEQLLLDGYPRAYAKGYEAGYSAGNSQQGLDNLIFNSIDNDNPELDRSYARGVSDGMEARANDDFLAELNKQNDFNSVWLQQQLYNDMLKKK
jgi:ribosome modulation factor